jgi:hypothetical protein
MSDVVLIGPARSVQIILTEVKDNYCGLARRCYNRALSRMRRFLGLLYPLYAGVVKLVDTSDSKSDASNGVPVQVRPPVPIYK